MLKENTLITLFPDDMFRLHAILLDEDRDASLDFLATVIKKKADVARPYKSDYAAPPSWRPALRRSLTSPRR